MGRGGEKGECVGHKKPYYNVSHHDIILHTYAHAPAFLRSLQKPRTGSPRCAHGADSLRNPTRLLMHGWPARDSVQTFLHSASWRNAVATRACGGRAASSSAFGETGYREVSKPLPPPSRASRLALLRASCHPPGRAAALLGTGTAAARAWAAAL